MTYRLQGILWHYLVSFFSIHIVINQTYNLVLFLISKFVLSCIT